MLVRYHGEPVTPAAPQNLSLARVAGRPTVGFMFGALADDPANRVPDGPATVAALTSLGTAMAAEPSNANSNIPAVYTYFGQFIDHDITKTEFDPSLKGPDGKDPIERPDLAPLSRDDAIRLVSNIRTEILDLDSLYNVQVGEGQDAAGRMILGTVSPSGGASIATADRFHDLPRRPMIQNPTPEQLELDRQALIGDPRNDENLLVAQFHVAFLRSHNALMDRGLPRDEARRQMRRRYQWAVLHDFLKRVCDPAVFARVVEAGDARWDVADASDLFMPLEFSGAAFRFGHSMIRPGYNHNEIFTRRPFIDFFTFTALSGSLNPSDLPQIQFPTLPDNWIIDWVRFFSPPGAPDQPGLNPARAIDSQITPPLGELPDIVGRKITELMGRLAARNLLRGYLLGLPTGQAVARHLGVALLPRQVLRDAIPAAALAEVEAAGFIDRTPLWFYILAEAGDPAGPNGQHLGPVGSTIVAETLWNLARHASDSVVVNPPSQDDLNTGEFTLKGIVRIGQDAGMGALT